MTNQDAAAPATGLPDVRPGQVWADNDKRSTGRHVRVERVTDGWAFTLPCDPRGQVVGERVYRIAVRRFRPTSNGYRLVQDAEATS